MKQPYNWDYTIRVKTKEGTFEYEKETLDNLDLLLQKHQNYEEIQATRNKLKCDKCKIQLSEVFIQQSQFGKLRLCRECNNKYLKYMENVKKLKKLNV